MKLRISELLNDYADDAQELPFPSGVSADRIRARTMARVQPQAQPKKSRRRLSSLAACAVLAAVLCVSAAAYQLLGPGALLDSFFARENAPLSGAQLETLDGMGTTQLPASADNGVTLTPLAAIMDERTLYLRLRVEAPEGTALPDMGEQEDHVFLDFDLRYTDTGKRDICGAMQKARWLADDTPGDNVTEFVLILYCNIDANLLDGAERTLYVNDLLLHPQDGEDYVLLEGEWTFPLSPFYQSREVTVDVAGLTRWDEEAQCTVQLEELRITPLSVAYRFSYDGSAQQLPPALGLELVLADGSTVSVTYGSGTISPQGSTGSHAFDAPIPLEEIVSIRFGEHVLTLPESAA